MNKLFRVGTSLPASYIQREKIKGRPFKAYRHDANRYRPIDLIARANAQTLPITRFACGEVRENISSLLQEQGRLHAEIERLQHVSATAKHVLSLNAISVALTNETLLTAAEIVAGAMDFHANMGVYFLLDGDEIVYVGQSVDVGSRVRSHIGRGFDRYAFTPCAPEILDKLESLYIHALRPRLNGSFRGVEHSAAPLTLEKLLAGGP